MSLIHSFDLTKHFAELNTSIVTSSGIKHPPQRRAEAVINLGLNAIMQDMVTAGLALLDLDYWEGLGTPSVDVQAVLEAANNAAVITVLGLGAIYQPLDADLTAIAALTTTSFGRGRLTEADATAARVALGLVLGTDIYSKAAVDAGFQPLDADLTSWAGVTRAAGFDTFATTPTSANLLALVTNETGTGSLVFATSPTLVTPALGTPASGTLTNTTGFLLANLAGAAAGVLTFLVTPSSANLISAVTDETGTGALVFATSPTLVTPALGTPASGTLTNTTGFPIANLAGAGTGVLTFLATPTSANLAAAVTNETGSGALVFATSPALVTPDIGVAAATSINIAGGGAIAFLNAGVGTTGLTLTNSTNITTSVLTGYQWMRVGNVVTVSGSVTITPTAAANTATALGISLPVASNISSFYQLAGVASATGAGQQIAGTVIGDATNDRAILQFPALSTSAFAWQFHFTYQVI